MFFKDLQPLITVHIQMMSVDFYLAWTRTLFFGERGGVISVHFEKLCCSWLLWCGDWRGYGNMEWENILHYEHKDILIQ